jgi:vacuolar-type H+-ATPase subunit C/Vma6
MNRTSRYAFILAKIYGKIGKTYVQANFQDLLRLKRLEEVFDLLFPGERASVAQEPLSAELEGRIMRAGIRSMVQVLLLLRNPEDILVHMLRKFEYQNVKSVIRSLTREEREEPVLWDLGKYALLRPGKGRDLEKALAASRYSWVLPHVRSRPLFEVENMLDRDYYARLLKLARKLPRQDRGGVLRLINLETSLTDVTWALRLRFFFGLDLQAARPLMIPGMVHSHRRAVSEAFEIPADSVEGWRKWKYAWLINDQLGEAFRAPDPVRAEQKAARRLVLRAHQLCHEDPFTLTPIVAFFKLKELETGMLKIAVEALRLSVSEHDVLSMLGAE